MIINIAGNEPLCTLRLGKTRSCDVFVTWFPPDQCKRNNSVWDIIPLIHYVSISWSVLQSLINNYGHHATLRFTITNELREPFRKCGPHRTMNSKSALSSVPWVNDVRWKTGGKDSLSSQRVCKFNDVWSPMMLMVSRKPDSRDRYTHPFRVEKTALTSFLTSFVLPSRTRA